MTRLLCLCSFIFLTSTSAFAQMVRFQQIDTNLFRSSQPESPEDYARLQEQGIRILINLRKDDSVNESALRAAHYGMKQINIPLWTESTPEDYEKAIAQIQRILDKPHPPVIIHCRAGKDRTGLIAALYRTKRQAWTPEAAYKEWRAMGLSDEWGVEIQKFFWSKTLGARLCSKAHLSL